MLKILFALMVLVNVAVFLWPAGDKAPFFESRASQTSPAIKASSMLLLTETVMTNRTAVSSPALAQPSQQPADSEISQSTPVAAAPESPNETASVSNSAPEPAKKPEPSTESENVAQAAASDTKKAKDTPAPEVAVTPITLPSFSKDRKATTTSAQDRPGETDIAKAPEEKKLAKAETAASEKTPPKVENKKAESAPAPKKPDPETPEPVAKAKPAPAARTGECVRIGPFSKDEELADAGEALGEMGARYTERTVPSRDVRTWRVFAGPFATHQETVDKDTVLALAGFSDRYVMNDVNGQKFISLGVFSAEKTAEALRERLTGQPMVINVRPEIRQLNPTKWVEVAAPGLNSADKSTLETRAWPSRRTRVRVINCRPAVG